MSYRKHLQPNLSGQDARHALLAFAFVRGIPYRRIEFSNRENNAPKALEVAKFAGALPPDFTARLSLDEVQIRLAPIDAWLHQPAPKAFADHVALSREAQILRKQLNAAKRKAAHDAGN